MLKSFRGMTKGIGAWIIVGVIVVVFGLVGVPQLDNFGQSGTLTVGNKTYSVRDIEREFSRLMENQRRDTGEVLTRESAIEVGLLEAATNNLIFEGIYVEEAKKLGITVTDKMIQQFLNTQENLLNPKTGKFDNAMLSRLVQSNNISVSEFKRRVATELVRNQINAGIGVGSQSPVSIARFLALRQSEERVIKTTTLPLPEIAEATDAQKQSFYASNVSRYETPERRQYTLVMLTKETVASRVKVDPTEVESLYASRAASLSTPEKRSFVSAQFKTKEIADAVVEAIASGSTLQEAATAQGAVVTAFTDEVKVNLIEKNVADAIFTATDIGPVGPVQGDFGIVVADISAITPGVTVTLEEIRDDLEDELYAEEYRDVIEELYNDLQLAGDAGESLAVAAAGLDLDIRVVGPSDASFFTAEGLIEDDIPNAVHSAAFAMPINSIFEEVELGSGQSAFIEVTNITPAMPQPFENVIDDVASDWLAEKKADTISDISARFEALIAQGTSFEAAAEELGGEVVSRTLTQFEPSPEVPASLVRPLFSLPINEVASAPTVTGDGAFAAQIESVRFTPNSRYNTTSQAFQRQLSDTMGRELYDAYLLEAQEEFTVNRNETAIARNFGADQ